jgi:uncharacterized RDD family membrane protein YckC
MTQPDANCPANLWRRLAAIAYDWLLLASVLFATTFVLILLRGGAVIEPGTWWYGVVLIAVAFLFYGWCWTHGGQTLGLRAWKLRVVTADGAPLSWPDAARRFVASAILFLPPGLGLIWSLLDSQRRCWHDRLSRSQVVRLPE